VTGNNFQLITTDRPQWYDNELNGDGKRVLSPMQPNPSAASNTVTVALSASEISPVVGDDVELTAIISPGYATGTVTFTDDSTTLGTANVTDGSASFAVTSIASGSHVYTAMYSGDATYLKNTSNSLTLTTQAAATGSGGTQVCDIYAAGGTPCVAAHSTVRALFGSYSGGLYQVKRASDNTTLTIGTSSAGGYVNAGAQDSFCTGTTCTITTIYDQTSNHNG
jgi:hypothetical protein